MKKIIQQISKIECREDKNFYKLLNLILSKQNVLYYKINKSRQLKNSLVFIYRDENTLLIEKFLGVYPSSAINIAPERFVEPKYRNFLGIIKNLFGEI